MGQQLATLDLLKDEPEFVVRLEKVDELQNVRVPAAFEQKRHFLQHLLARECLGLLRHNLGRIELVGHPVPGPQQPKKKKEEEGRKKKKEKEKRKKEEEEKERKKERKKRRKKKKKKEKKKKTKKKADKRQENRIDEMK